MTSSGSREEIKNHLHQVLLEISKESGERFDASHYNWESLNSLSKIEVLSKLQDYYQVELSHDEVSLITNFDGMIRAIDVKLSGKKSQTIDRNSKSTLYMKRGEAKSDFLKKFSGYILKKLMHYYFDIHTFGAEKIPKDGVFVIVANHNSHLDSLVLMYASDLPYDQFMLMAAKDYYFAKSGIKLRLLKSLINIAPFDRFSHPNAILNNMEVCRYWVSHSKNLILYPEATRSLTGQMQPFKYGTAMIACELGLPIIPAYINGTFECLKKGENFPKRGSIKVWFADPISTVSKGGDDKFEVCRRITAKMQSAIQEMRENAR